MGRVGFFYNSMKDQLRWAGLNVKNHIRLISNIGKVLSLSDEDYSKEKTRAMKMSSEDIKSALISAFGDGK